MNWNNLIVPLIVVILLLVFIVLAFDVIDAHH